MTPKMYYVIYEQPLMQQCQPKLLLLQKWKYELEAGRPQARSYLSFSASIFSNYWTPQRQLKSNVGPELKCSEESNFRYLGVDKGGQRTFRVSQKISSILAGHASIT